MSNVTSLNVYDAIVKTVVQRTIRDINSLEIEPEVAETLFLNSASGFCGDDGLLQDVIRDAEQFLTIPSSISFSTNPQNHSMNELIKLNKTIQSHINSVSETIGLTKTKLNPKRILAIVYVYFANQAAAATIAEAF